MSDCEVIETVPRPTAVVRADVPLAELPGFFSRAFHAVFQVLERQGVAPAGPPFGLYASPPRDTVLVEAGVPVSAEISAEGEVVPSRLPGGRAASTVHVGPYDTVEQSYAVLGRWISEQGLSHRPGPMWEAYLTDPEAEPDPAKWQTRIFQPVD